MVKGFQHKHEAERFLGALKERLKKFGLALHPEKTRLIEFGRFAAINRARRGESKPETFNFLGFTHICARNQQGTYTVLRNTITKRMRTKLQEVKREMMRRRHEPVMQLGKWLRAVVQGYFNYHTVPGNIFTLGGISHRNDKTVVPSLKTPELTKQTHQADVWMHRRELDPQSPDPAPISRGAILR